jgi:AraC-like DNA-binding protein
MFNDSIITGYSASENSKAEHQAISGFPLKQQVINTLKQIVTLSRAALTEYEGPTQEELNQVLNAASNLNDILQLSYSSTQRFYTEDDESILQLFFNTIHEHYSEAFLTIDWLSRKLSISRAKLNRKIKLLTGLAVMEHLRHYRLQQAATKLKQTFDSVAEIAYNCGFNDPNYFCRSFTKTFKCSPTAYRAHKKNETKVQFIEQEVKMF